MKRGHRRTQSAHLGSHFEESPDTTRPAIQPYRHNIMKLLNQCQLKAPEKVCQVEQLNNLPQGEDSKLFNFGKGLLKVGLKKRPKPEMQANLVSIP
jgi:hypothetical protein